MHLGFENITVTIIETGSEAFNILVFGNRIQIQNHTIGIKFGFESTIVPFRTWPVCIPMCYL